MSYSIENALFQWEYEGETRYPVARGRESLRSEERSSGTAPARGWMRWWRSFAGGSGRAFTLDELADLYGEGTDWVITGAATLPGAPTRPPP